MRVKETDTAPASDNQELKIRKFISVTVTFRVKNGHWDDDALKDKTVTLTGHEGDKLALTEKQIPAVGNRPDREYKAGSWDVTPVSGDTITENTIYTYTYAKKSKIAITVTFRVVNGSWNDGTRENISGNLFIYEGDTVVYTEKSFPAVGTKPDKGCREGSWDVTLDAETVIRVSEDTTFIYTYEKIGDTEHLPEKYQPELFIDPSSIGPSTPYTGPIVKEGLIYDVAGGKWNYWEKNRIRQDLNGVVQYNGNWFMIRFGSVDTKANGLYDYDGGIFAFAAGQLRTNVNDLWQNPQDGDWYFLANGQVQKQYTGLALYDGAWFYVEAGKFASSYTGVDFTVVNGQLVP